MGKDQKYKEVGRVRVGESEEAVLSECYTGEEMRGYFLNTYITTLKYTGPTKGLFLSEDIVVDYLSLFPKEDLELALSAKEQKEVKDKKTK